MHLPGGVLRRDVQGSEVVKIVLDIGTFGDRETHLAEDGDAFLGNLADRVQPAVAHRARRQGDVDRLGGKPGFEGGAVEALLARLDCRGDTVLDAVERLPGGLARRRIESAKALHLFRDRALAAERRHANGFERGQIGRARHLGEQGCFERVDVGHRNVLIPAGQRPVRRPISARPEPGRREP